MKIVHIQVHVGPSGNAVVRLHDAMRRCGIDSSVLTIMSPLNRDRFYQYQTNKLSIFRKVVDHTVCHFKKRGLKEGSYMYSALPLIGPLFHTHPVVKDADVVYLHWLADRGISMYEIETLAKTGKPIIIFMHDMWTFTGGCHHSFECGHYSDGCRDCHLFSNNKCSAKNDLRKKQKTFGKYKNIAFVSPSEWMADCARESVATKNNLVTSISNIIDENVFKPGNKEKARKILGIPLDKKVILYGCQGGLYNKIKGWQYLVEAVNKLNIDDMMIVVFGCGDVPESHDTVKCPIKFLGRFNEECKLAQVYQAADVFVSPSLSESFGMTLLESPLCGTPVVGFNNTAIPELVKTGVTGYLAENKNSEDLARGIQKILKGEIEFKGTDYASVKVIKKHLSLIEKLGRITI